MLPVLRNMLYFHLNIFGNCLIILQNKEYEPYAKAKNVEELGYNVLHEAAAKTVDTLTACLENYGITDCILSPERDNMHDDGFFAKIMKYSCYSVFISEALKFVPKVRIFYSRLPLSVNFNCRRLNSTCTE